MIDPGQTFEAILTPPRAGTFIYHTHMHDAFQLRGGLVGPLIVVEPGETFDPSADHVFTIATAHASADELALHHQRRAAAAAAGRARRRSSAAALHQYDDVLDQCHDLSQHQGSNNSVEAESGRWRRPPPSRRTSQSAVDTITIGQTRDYTFMPDGRSLVLQIWPDPSMPAVTIPVKVI